MNLLDVVKGARWHHWRDSLVWLVLTFSTGLFLFVGSFILLPYLGMSPNLRDLSRHGEFALYSISLLGSAVYVVMRGQRLAGMPEVSERAEPLSHIVQLFRRISFPGATFFIILILALTALSTTVFSGSVAANVMGISDIHSIDTRILHSALLMFAATLLGFFVTLSENVANTNPPDYRELMKGDYSRFEDRFDDVVSRKPEGGE